MYLLGLATGINGTTFGAMLFVGLVDARTFLSIIRNDGADQFIKTLFPVWWPNGRDLMAPLGIAGLLLNGLAYHHTGNPVWLISASTHLVTLVWTAALMRESISTLVEAKGTNLKKIVQTFCLLHAPRVVFAGVGYIASLYSLMQ